ncbi:peptidase M52 [Acidihalobacter aeolianus]|uniref:Peptidase M52 n=1 Tax=Acidihalobacter aeolianus TaxID=2792603 RepID=A0A1D8K6F4_9GAMM|nr:HyaD/HybD family hydrogenase maturation endopeptidase [Acidihalobacter aeolianus]AOV16565.1 peptidase M52 [Acidihalobacter aeolianus]
MTSRVLVLGLGNTLLGDEGIGVYAARELERTCSTLPHVDCLDGGTLSFTLAGPIADCDRLIVIDAAELHASPGSVCVFENEAMDRYVGAGGKRSVHEVSLADLLSMACLTDELPAHRALIGIQPECVDWADVATAAGQRGIAEACALAQALIARWEQADAA